MNRLPLYLAAALVTLSGPIGAEAASKLRWEVEQSRDAVTLAVRSDDTKAPVGFLVECGLEGEVDISVGAPMDKVKKAGEPVSVTVAAGGKTFVLKGKARFNQFSRAMELFLQTNTDNGMFAVLATGKPVTVTRPATIDLRWPAADPGVIKRWVDYCKVRTEH